MTPQLVTLTISSHYPHPTHTTHHTHTSHTPYPHTTQPTTLATLIQAVYRRVMDNQPENFVYPYNLGRWINLRMVLHCRFRPELDGYFGWPVLQSCDQYTLTVSTPPPLRLAHPPPLYG